MATKIKSTRNAPQQVYFEMKNMTYSDCVRYFIHNVFG